MTLADPELESMRLGLSAITDLRVNYCVFPRHPALVTTGTLLAASRGLDKDDFERSERPYALFKERVNQDLESKEPLSQRKE